MPYGKLSDLPDSVREHIPKHAQLIYRHPYLDRWVAHLAWRARAAGAYGA